MIGVKKHRWWRRSVNVTPTAATLVGLASGSALGVLAAFPDFDGLSFYLWIFLALFGGPWGYTFWLMTEPARAERFLRIVRVVAFVAIAALLLALPGFWSQIRLSRGRLVVFLLGGMCGLSMLVVGTGWGIVHALGYLSCLLRRGEKGSVDSLSSGVWDRELDYDSPAGE
jgi:hypothetical protein